VGHVVCLGVSGGRDNDALFLMLGWARCRSHKKYVRIRYIELMFLYSVHSVAHVVRPGYEMSTHYFLCSRGPSADPIKSVRGHAMENMCFYIRCNPRVT
jgi:hypothetical protein